MRIYQPWLLIKPLFRLLGYHRRQMKATREINAFMQDVINLKRKDSEKEQMQNKETKVGNTNINRKEFEEESNEGKQEEVEKSIGEKEIEADRKEEYADVQYQFTKTKSFLELLLEIGNSSHEKLTDAELLPELTTLFFAALDTTSTSNTTTLLLLAMHPEVLQKVSSLFLFLRFVSFRDLGCYEYIADFCPPKKIPTRLKKKKNGLQIFLYFEDSFGKMKRSFYHLYIIF